MIYGFFGDMGSGKTLSMTKYAMLHHLTGYKVYSNYGLNIPHEIIDKTFMENIIKVDKNFDGKTIFCLDEFDMYIDSRRSMKEGNLLISYFLKQVRKKNIKLFYSAQMKNTIDKRLRILTRTNILCKGRTVYCYKEGHLEPFIIQMIYNDVYVNDKLIKKSRFIGNPYFNLYDTKELIIPE